MSSVNGNVYKVDPQLKETINTNFYSVEFQHKVNNWYQLLVDGLLIKDNTVYTPMLASSYPITYPKIDVSSSTLSCDILIAGISYVTSFIPTTKKYLSGYCTVESHENDINTFIESNVSVYCQRYNDLLYIGNYTTTNGLLNIPNLNSDLKYTVIAQDVKNKYQSKMAVLTPSNDINSIGIEQRYTTNNNINSGNGELSIYKIYTWSSNPMISIKSNKVDISPIITNIEPNIFSVTTNTKSLNYTYTITLVDTDNGVSTTFTNEVSQPPLTPTISYINPTYYDIYSQYGSVDRSKKYIGVIVPKVQENDQYIKFNDGSSNISLNSSVLITISSNIGLTDTIISVLDNSYFSYLNVGQLGFIDNEIIQFISYDSVNKNITIKRGCIDTQPSIHTANSIITFYTNISTKGYDSSINTISGNASICTSKACGKQSSILGTTLSNRHIYPLPVSNVSINGLFYPTTLKDSNMVITWDVRTLKVASSWSFNSNIFDSTLMEDGETFLVNLKLSDGSIYGSFNNLTTNSIRIDARKSNIYKFIIEVYTVNKDGLKCLNPFVWNVTIDKPSYDYNFNIHEGYIANDSKNVNFKGM